MTQLPLFSLAAEEAAFKQDVMGSVRDYMAIDPRLGLPEALSFEAEWLWRVGLMDEVKRAWLADLAVEGA